MITEIIYAVSPKTLDDLTYAIFTIPIHTGYSVQAEAESDHASDQAEQLLFNTLGDMLAFCDQASDQASDQAKSQANDIIEHSVHGKVKAILQSATN
jgi:hypothetical protein